MLEEDPEARRLQWIRILRSDLVNDALQNENITVQNFGNQIEPIELGEEYQGTRIADDELHDFRATALMSASKSPVS